MIYLNKKRKMIYFKIKDWKIENREEVYKFFETIKDGVYELKPYNKTRTDEQNKYLRGVVYPIIADYIGEEVDYIHGVMGMKFLLDKTKKSPYVKSTAKLTTKEFINYVENIKDFVATFGIQIPDPYDFITQQNENEKNLEQN